MSDDEDFDIGEEDIDQEEANGSDEDAGLVQDDTRNALFRQKSYQVMAESDVISESSKLIKEAMDVLGLPSQAAAVALLRHFGYGTSRRVS